MTRRADRLFEIIQVFRKARAPMTAAAIAVELEISKRTVYRDISVLINRRIPIRGEAGTGYVLDRAFELPPLAFTPEEICAVVLGSQWVTAHADGKLARAAASVLAKLAVSVPHGQRRLIEDPVVVAAPEHKKATIEVIDLARLRAWCQSGHKVWLAYVDKSGRQTERTVWPFLLGYHHDETKVLMAWCELRGGFRIFRLERVQALEFGEHKYPDEPATLRKRWLAELESGREGPGELP